MKIQHEPVCSVVSSELQHSLGLQEQLLVEGLVFVTPLVSASPARMAVASGADMASTRLKGKIEQVVQTDFFGSRKLSRAELGPACLDYLGRRRRRARSEQEQTCKLFLFVMSLTSSLLPPPMSPPCLPPPPPLWGGLLSKFLLFCGWVRRGPGKLSALGKAGSRLRL